MYANHGSGSLLLVLFWMNVGFCGRAVVAVQAAIACLAKTRERVSLITRDMVKGMKLSRCLTTNVMNHLKSCVSQSFWISNHVCELGVWRE